MQVLNLATLEKQDEMLDILRNIQPVDISGAPGPQVLKAGTMKAGYFGVTSSVDLISGDALALAIGLSAGTAQNSDAGWLKWIKDGTLMYVAKKPFRHTISWDMINNANAVYGSLAVEIGGRQYLVRLLTGGNNNPALSANGEWNMIMYGVHKDQQPNWDNFEDADIVVGDGNGRLTWCQETSASNAAYRVTRGSAGVTYFYTDPSSGTNVIYGWRPVLELVS